MDVAPYTDVSVELDPSSVEIGRTDASVAVATVSVLESVAFAERESVVDVDEALERTVESLRGIV